MASGGDKRSSRWSAAHAKAPGSVRCFLFVYCIHIEFADCVSFRYNCSKAKVRDITEWTSMKVLQYDGTLYSTHFLYRQPKDLHGRFYRTLKCSNMFLTRGRFAFITVRAATTLSNGFIKFLSHALRISK